jgi:glyoxylase-like metal-dependent hydrolase (beta-lactamase superfamily II)
MGAMQASLHRMGVPLTEIRYALATHYHMDHAGVAQEFKEAGVRLLVMETQVAAIPLMKTHVKPRDHYREITPIGNVVLSFAESRAFLVKLGIAGEILPTPGHSEDSVSLLLDDGSVFSGDLPALTRGEDRTEVVSSWRLLRERGATRVYPGHGPIRAIFVEVESESAS